LGALDFFGRGNEHVVGVMISVRTVGSEYSGVSRREGDVLAGNRVKGPTTALTRRVILEMSCGHQLEMVKENSRIPVVVAISK
jgi:hypothetical protein